MIKQWKASYAIVQELSYYLHILRSAFIIIIVHQGLYVGLVSLQFVFHYEFSIAIIALMDTHHCHYPLVHCPPCLPCRNDWSQYGRPDQTWLVVGSHIYYMQGTLPNISPAILITLCCHLSNYVTADIGNVDLVMKFYSQKLHFETCVILDFK